MILTHEELDRIINWYMLAEHFDQTNDLDDALVQKLERELLGN